MLRPRVLLADDHAETAEQLRALLEPHFDVVGLVEDGALWWPRPRGSRPT